jgi:hypothetical protein
MMHLLAMLAAVVAIEPGGPAASSIRDPATADARFESQLLALDPAHPRDYFELGEIVAAEAVDRADLMLAKKLFVLAYEIDRTNGKRDLLAAPACLALAALPPLSRERPWLMGIAATLDPRYSAVGLEVEEAKIPTSDGYRIASGLGLLRAGEAMTARGLLDNPESMAILKKYERLLSASGSVGVLGKIKAELSRGACTTCGGTHFTKGVGNGDARKCPVCDAMPSWKVDDEEFSAQVLFESRLLAGIHTSWGAQVFADDESPLREADPAAVAVSLGVDVSKSVYRSGAWTQPDAAEKPRPAPDTLPPVK